MLARVFLAFLALTALAVPAPAQSRPGGVPPLDRVLPVIRQNMPGTFYDAEGPFFAPDGSAAYRIKWMTPDGRVIWFYVDARSGRLLGGVPAGGPPGNPGGNRWQNGGGGGPGGNWGGRGGPHQNQGRPFGG